jgi:hypothetical protein
MCVESAVDPDECRCCVCRQRIVWLARVCFLGRRAIKTIMKTPSRRSWCVPVPSMTRQTLVAVHASPAAPVFSGTAPRKSGTRLRKFLLVRQGPSLSTIQLSYVGSVVRPCALILFVAKRPGTRPQPANRPNSTQMAWMRVSRLSYLRRIWLSRRLHLVDCYVKAQGLTNNTASGRRLLAVIDTITVYYVMANVPSNESESLSSTLETNSSQASFKALLVSKGVSSSAPLFYSNPCSDT